MPGVDVRGVHAFVGCRARIASGRQVVGASGVRRGGMGCVIGSAFVKIKSNAKNKRQNHYFRENRSHQEQLLVHDVLL